MRLMLFISIVLALISSVALGGYRVKTAHSVSLTRKGSIFRVDHKILQNERSTFGEQLMQKHRVNLPLFPRIRHQGKGNSGNSTDRYATTSFIFGVGATAALIAFLIAISGTSTVIITAVFLMPILGLIAMIFGIKALRHRTRNRGLALAGLIMGMLASLVFSVMVLLLFTFAGL